MHDVTLSLWFDDKESADKAIKAIFDSGLLDGVMFTKRGKGYQETIADISAKAAKYDRIRAALQE